MPDLLIQLKKKADGTAALTCTRADGSVTWQRQEGAQGRFFPLHDLTHYAVETVLGHRHGFYGMVADGWNMTDFGAPWPRGPIPADADPSELIVGFLDTERAGGVRWTVEDFNDKVAAYHRQHGLEGSCVLTEEQLRRIRELRQALFERWHALPAGDVMELEFDRRAQVP